ncbi:MAG: class B sortase [Coriobacteriia bacterium]|nr:class B sortase [Coriobacteriia bacterium]
MPGTGVHYPVVQGPDNTKYLTKNATGAKSESGAIFADVRCSPYVKGDPAARSTILYGHNMKDGSMFGRIDDYGSSSSFYKAHPLIQYVDAAGNGGLWRIYSVRKSTTADSVYTYPVTAPYTRRVASWSAQSAVDVGFKPKSDGWSLTLSTCTYDRADGTGRILVQGELLESYSNGDAGN